MANEPFLHQENEWQALWWLPEDPDAKVPGIFRYSPSDGLQLPLLGGFETSAGTEAGVTGVAYMKEEGRWPIILGGDGSQLFTLLDCTLTRSFGAIKPLRQTVLAQTALLECHLREKGAPDFSYVEASIENLSVWAANSALHERRPAQAANEDHATHSSDGPAQQQNSQPQQHG